MLRLHQASLKTKILLDLTTTSLVTVTFVTAVTSATSRAILADRVENDEIPTRLNAVRSEIERLLTAPVEAFVALARNARLQRWGAEGEDEAGPA